MSGKLIQVYDEDWNLVGEYDSLKEALGIELPV